MLKEMECGKDMTVSCRDARMDDFVKSKCWFLVKNFDAIEELDDRYLMVSPLVGRAGLVVYAEKPISSPELNGFMSLVHEEEDKILQRAVDYINSHVSTPGGAFCAPEISSGGGHIAVCWKRFLEGEAGPTLFWVSLRFSDLLPTHLAVERGSEIL